MSPLFSITNQYYSTSMKLYISKQFLLGISLYSVIGIFSGFFAVVDLAREDVLIAKQCVSFLACVQHNAYIIPAGIVIWPLYFISNPLIYSLIALVVLFLFVVIVKLKQNGSKKFSSQERA